ncbi:DUF4328 domain-containing protein [Catenulispora sp. NL8]|uniref:DUF4328 domain-containing protein n=1 Tax=Catenulispora pinistramenti TaxID=2705254 RepID=A0ABS5KI82_9ACTN|nr:DUF4328 domain-containing protein [Catenulispora pinistramenti]MBS2546093.1 DUF4328 domain-containing protein [Catenulispora pinistramenti]
MTGSPISDYGYPAPFAAPRPRPRTSVAGLGVALIVLLALDAAVAALAAGLLVWRHQVLGTLLTDPGSLGPDDLHNSDRLALGAVGWLYIFLVPTIVIFICWFWAARNNAELYFPNRGTLAVGWAIGGWFLPLANWVLPLFVARDIHRGTMAGRKGKPAGGQITGWWWGPYVIAEILALACSGENGNAKKAADITDFVHDLQAVATTGIAALIATIAAALLAIGYVRTITNTQNARNREGDWYGGPGPAVLPGPYGMGYGYGYGAPMPGYSAPQMPVPGYPAPQMPMPGYPAPQMPMPMPAQSPAPPTETAPVVQDRIPVADTQIADTHSADTQSAETWSSDAPKPAEPGDWLTPPS